MVRLPVPSAVLAVKSARLRLERAWRRHAERTSLVTSKADIIFGNLSLNRTSRQPGLRARQRRAGRCNRPYNDSVDSHLKPKKGNYMKPEQKTVAIGAASGVLLMAVSVWLLTRLLPSPSIADVVAGRLAYALKANVFAVVPLFIMFITIGNSRFLSDAIDPTRRAESPSMEIDGRVADNTLQQNFVFVVASLGLSTVVSLHYLQVVWACAIVFVVARAAFWLGYRMNPLYRAPGMSATAYMNLGMILYVLFRVFWGK
jgi:hypothetical protein